MRRHQFALLTTAVALALSSAPLLAATPTAEQALRLVPIQKGVEYDRPAAEETKACRIVADKGERRTGWLVEGPAGQTLRKFADSNGDNVVDRWSYYREGLEVYRDIDADFNGKADNYRWFHTGGTRWGVDDDEDGRIDRWRIISAEEVAAEVVEALRSRDATRFGRLLMSEKELVSLGMTSARAKELREKLQGAGSRFRTLAGKQRDVGSKTRFVDFGGARPGIVPLDASGSSKDLMVYENVQVLVENDGKHGQVQIGTLVRMGNVWRLIDAPQPTTAETLGYFFQASLAGGGRSPAAAAAASGPSEAMQAQMSRLEQLDLQVASAAARDVPELNRKRTELLEKLVSEARAPELRTQWVRQLADTVSAAVQTGGYPEGVRKLESLERKLAARKSDAELLSYVAFRRMSAAYSLDLQAPKADFGKIQAGWLRDLEGFVKRYPRSSDAAEAMLQLAVAEEFGGGDREAAEWYGKIVSNYPRAAAARKAAGARRRLQSVGKSIELRGPTVDGRTVDLARSRGKTVLIQYWATWCEPCKTDMARLKELHARYGRRGFEIIGVNLDVEKSDVAAYLKGHPLPWPQLFEPGGLEESRLATELGIITLPTMILVDKKGQVVSRNLHITELEGELKKLR